ncbi:electron carrier [Blastomyces dermatitidis]|uniref:Fe-S cluster assembly protein DRE2 n=3 Tax=Blastomyces TaxID=229219 RepID=DRE2_BLAGS|nr:Fe-S cluster assembly protein DRE2 [Blastomyces gilchristii SLH14081]XP_045273830.1 Fe-S cluster assembly protein DRE2 [Blastomyces dermatitidis ER-3]C5GYL7.1 RecName: Full=Fe-S cluster assembly protein DRE2; AltName: Full=Anamorsin homolog [Blastomyces dermatitidis ER-3]C5K3T8.1 RecName: Full=Fe-S cluster assembly protein DRE2; AltName: Full=Anamorsin homolog [Blastomyces gilchristii SLH14081]EGE85332.1 Fe-S cluster assembly protein DRE2 [Blastomyces dermatitidis ATCC 18188]EQL30023.1 Fe-S
MASTGRVLLLSPPSLSSHPEKLNAILGSHTRDRTDLQMLDRLVHGLVSLPASTYDIVLLLTGADNTLAEPYSLVTRDIIQQVVHSLKPAGKLRSQDNKAWGLRSSGNNSDDDNDNDELTFRNEAILAGLVFDDNGELLKPDVAAQQAVPLKLGRRKKEKERRHPSGNDVTNGKVNAPSSNGVNASTSTATATATTTTTTTPKTNPAPSGVGFIDFSDDYGVPMEEDPQGSDDELIDEDELLGEDDMGRPIVQPPECRPKPGKRRRACKDCSCGLSQKLEAEDKAKRATADKALETIMAPTMKLGSSELAEVDFTVQGKVGSCGNCSLGDAFRCDGCPYIGLPAFKPGEEVRLLNNDVQL